MSLPKKVRDQFLARFDELIVEGNSLVDSIEVIPPHSKGSVFVTYTTYRLDPQRLARWKTNCMTLFQPFAKQGTKVKEQVDVFSKTGGKKPEVEYCIGILEAFRDDFDRGFLDDLLLKVEAEVASDYMGQAEELLKEGKRGNFDHVPAAVLTGAVLEKALRTLCGQQQPPVSITTPKGDPKTMNPLIDDLKAAGLFNELKAKQLRSWADIRNKAAHGEFEQFKRSDVEQMIQGITNFLADYLA
jgi:hypothetical protein